MKTNFIQGMHEMEGHEKIDHLQKKIETTAENIAISQGIIAQTPSDAESNRLKEKNIQRQHAIGSMKKEIRDIEQAITQRGKEMST